MREQYLQMRKNGNFSMEWFYEYYKKNFNSEKHKILIPFEIFQQTFNFYFQNNANIILENLDFEFEITILTDKENKIINVT